MADMDFNIKSADGAGHIVKSSDLVGQIKTIDPSAQMSPDGLNVKFTDSQGTFDVPIPSILKQHGHNVVTAMPTEADESQVSTEYRFAIENMGDDARKASYLKSRLQSDHDIQDAQIFGSGSDWYYLNPQTQGWSALTNARGIDTSDIAQAGTMAAQLIGSVGGGIAGGIGGTAVAPGIGTVGGAALGAGAGGAMANTAMRGYLAANDPAYREAMPLGQHAGEVGKQAAIDVGLGGLFGGAAKLGMMGRAALKSGGTGGLAKFGPAVQKAAFTGPASTVGKAASSATGAVGSGVQKGLGTIAKSPNASSFVQYTAPFLDNPSLVGMLLRTPREALVGGTKGLGKLGGKINKPGLTRWSEEMLQPRPFVQAGEKFSRGVRGLGTETPTARDVLGNVGERFGQRFTGKSTDKLKRLAEEGAWEGPQGRKALDEMADILRTGEGRATTSARAGEALGGGAENLYKLGKGITGTTSALTKAGLRAGQGLGAGVSKASNVARGGFTAAQPLEIPVISRILAQKYLGPDKKSIIHSSPWLNPKPKGKIKDEILFAGR